MSNTLKSLRVCMVIVLLCSLVGAQSTNSSNTVVPTLVQFSGVLTDGNGKPLTGMVGVTFSLYQEQQGGAPLWLETQNVQPNANGQYTVMLGSTSSTGLPVSIFASGEAHWLGVQAQGQPEQPRVILLSVPYALKAGDATTVGGLPASAFVKANSTPSGQSAGKNANPATETQSYIPVFVNSSGGLGNSILYQSGTTEVGIGTTTPAATLEVNGTGKFDGLVNFAASQTFPGTLTGITAGTGITVTGSKSAPTVGINTTFANEYYAQLGAANTFTKNQTVSASLTAQQLVSTAAQGTAPLQVTSTTQVPNLNASQLGGLASSAFAQLGAASNTFTGSLTASSFSGNGSGLTNVTAANSNELGGLAPSAFAQLGAASNTFTGSLTASSFSGNGSALTNVNASELGGLSSSAFAQLANANTFTASQTVSGNLSATGVVTGSSYQIGSNLFAFGSYGNSNAFLGFAGNTTTTGAYNTASGAQALYSNTTGFVNTANGSAALYSNTTGGYNTAVGASALYANSEGTFNTATGGAALIQNSTGSYNNAFGWGALYSNTTGSPNDAFGYQALYNNTSNDNDAFGYQVLYSNTGGNNNDGFGYQALYSNTGGNNNDAFGYQALSSNTTGYANTAIGYQALYSNTTGSLNTAVGFGAMQSTNPTTCVAGEEPGYCVNEAFGYQALSSNTNGDENDAFGFQALYRNTSGTENDAFGWSALWENTTGYGNTGVGYAALIANTTGNELTCIGVGCSASDNISNATAIGAHAVVEQSNSLVLGGTGDHAVKVGIGTTKPSNILTIGRGAGHPVSDSWETYSSRRWKTNIHPLRNALNKVEQLRGVSYDLRDSGKHEIGVIAEEVGKVVPEVVTYEDNGKDARGVDYSRLTALLIEATKEQQALIRKQQQQIRTQQALLKAQLVKSKLQDAQIAELMSQVKAIQASLKTKGRGGSEIRTVKAQVPMVQQ